MELRIVIILCTLESFLRRKSLTLGLFTIFISIFSLCERLIYRTVLFLFFPFSLDNTELIQAMSVTLTDQFSHFIHVVREERFIFVKVRFTVSAFSRMFLWNINSWVWELVFVMISLWLGQSVARCPPRCMLRVLILRILVFRVDSETDLINVIVCINKPYFLLMADSHTVQFLKSGPGVRYVTSGILPLIIFLG